MFPTCTQYKCAVTLWLHPGRTLSLPLCSGANTRIPLCSPPVYSKNVQSLCGYTQGVLCLFLSVQGRIHGYHCAPHLNTVKMCKSCGGHTQGVVCLFLSVQGRVHGYHCAHQLYSVHRASVRHLVVTSTSFSASSPLCAGAITRILLCFPCVRKIKKAFLFSLQDSYMFTKTCAY